MNLYEVSYEIDGEVREQLVEANTPVEAQMKFMQNKPEGNVIVLCVVRQ
ncbi:MAG: hypothetical protein AB7F21_02995 [Desulfuromonadales bacterium]|nr:hypothetical protein [Desulfuromonas sp. KJ2020]MCP3176683.1 hypothetical protein [Desulfuromonas sp. KJ2020]